MKTLTYNLIQNPCFPPSSRIVPLAWGYYKSLFLWIFSAVIFGYLTFFVVVTNFLQEQKHGILGVAVEIKCSNLRNCIMDYLWIISPCCRFLTTSHI